MNWRCASHLNTIQLESLMFFNLLFLRNNQRCQTDRLTHKYSTWLPPTDSLVWGSHANPRLDVTTRAREWHEQTSLTSHAVSSGLTSCRLYCNTGTYRVGRFLLLRDTVEKPSEGSGMWGGLLGEHFVSGNRRSNNGLMVEQPHAFVKCSYQSL